MARSFEPSQSELVVLLLGQKQSGKSSTGNLILGRPAFGISTTRSSKATSDVFGKQVTVVDTPGWLADCPTKNQEVSVNLQKALSLCGPQPDVLLLVLSVRSVFGPEQWRDMEAQLRRLQILIWQPAMVLFTHGDCLGDMPIQEHIRRQGSSLQWLLERCRNRFHVLTNQPGTSEAEVQELFEKMQSIVDSSRRPVGGYMRRDFHQPTAPARAFSPLSFVLLGRRKSGKSTVGNYILNRKHFKTNTKTSHCSMGQGVVCGQSVTVVDTPGWSLYGLANPEKVKMEISQSHLSCLSGSKVVYLFAIPVDSFKEKDRKAVETYLSVLGEDFWTRTLVLFTFGDELKRKTVEEHVTKQGAALQWVMERCGYRHHVIDTNITDNNKQMVKLLEMVQSM